MSTITVLGAGAMGSAICTPLADAGWDVRLWGTWLDDHLLDAIERGENHPRTNQPFRTGRHPLPLLRTRRGPGGRGYSHRFRGLRRRRAGHENGAARHRQSRCTHGDLQGIP